MEQRLNERFSKTHISASGLRVVAIKKSLKMLGLRTTIYKVGNFNNATDWYGKAFARQPYFDELCYVHLNMGGFALGFQPESNPTPAEAESVMSYWGVDNIHDRQNCLIKLGASENVPPFNVGGDIITATDKDTFGNVLGLIYNPHFKVND